MQEKAIILRQKGYTYSQISNELNISKSTLSKWLNNYRLSDTEKVLLSENIKNRVEKGRMKSKISLRSKKVYLSGQNYNNSKREFDLFSKDPFFMYGLGLYNGHGAKKTNYYGFSHKDVEIHKVMILWLLKYIKISSIDLKFRIFISYIANPIECVEYWAASLDIKEEGILISKYNKNKDIINNKSSDNGIMTVYITKKVVLDKVLSWQKMAIQYYKQ